LFNKVDRSNLIPTTYELKIIPQKKSKIKYLNHLFLEGKWFYNYCLGSLPQNRDYYNWFKEIKKSKMAKIKVKDQFEERELKYLSSQMKEAIAQEILNSLKSLKQRKDNGKKIGKLKFTSKERPITLKQFNVTL